MDRYWPEISERTQFIHKIPNILYDFKINDELFKKYFNNVVQQKE